MLPITGMQYTMMRGLKGGPSIRRSFVAIQVFCVLVGGLVRNGVLTCLSLRTHVKALHLLYVYELMPRVGLHDPVFDMQLVTRRHHDTRCYVLPYRVVRESFSVHSDGSFRQQ
jgi:hypothetical protein